MRERESGNLRTRAGLEVGAGISTTHTRLKERQVFTHTYTHTHTHTQTHTHTHTHTNLRGLPLVGTIYWLSVFMMYVASALAISFCRRMGKSGRKCRRSERVEKKDKYTV